MTDWRGPVRVEDGNLETLFDKPECAARKPHRMHLAIAQAIAQHRYEDRKIGDEQTEDDVRSTHLRQQVAPAEDGRPDDRHRCERHPALVRGGSPSGRIAGRHEGEEQRQAGHGPHE